MFRSLTAFAFLLTVQPGVAAAFQYVSGTETRAGDLVAVWVKNGFELIVNLGSIDQIDETLQVSVEVPDEFDGDLVGARFTALGVAEPDRLATTVPIEPPPPAANLVLTTAQDASEITWAQVGEAQSALDPPQGGVAWLKLLNSVGAAGSPGVVRNTDDELVISSTLFASYTTNVGFSTDSIANRLTINTVTVVDPEGSGATYSIPLQEVVQTYQAAGDDFLLGTQVTDLGSLGGDNGASGLALLTLTVPEPGGLAAFLAATAALAARSRARGARRV